MSIPVKTDKTYNVMQHVAERMFLGIEHCITDHVCMELVYVSYVT